MSVRFRYRSTCQLLLGFSQLLILHAQAASESFVHKNLKLYGELIQGAMITGQLAQAQSIRVFEQDVYIDPKGRFVFGIGRDAPEKIALEVVWAEGGKEIVQVPVIQRQYNIQRVEGVDDKYVREPDPELLKRIQEEAAQVWKARQRLRPEADFLVGFQWPAKGPITGVYGSQRVFNGVPKRPHFGLDIAGPVGTPVYAPAPGKVSLTHREMYYSGGTLVIDHGQGISSTFIHLSKIHVQEGQFVKTGERIADIGATGRVTGPHLDWRINWFDQKLDPQLLLPPQNLAESNSHPSQE